MSQISVRLKQSGVNTIGIIIDADIDISKRWLGLQSILSNLGFILPSEMPTDGLVTASNGFKIGVWIMPDNIVNGMLEDFIAFLVPQDDPLFKIAYNTLEGIESKELNRYATVHKSKALIHTWLSWQEDPGTPLGLAITKRYLTTDEKTCSKLMQWLTNVFS